MINFDEALKEEAKKIIPENHSVAILGVANEDGIKFVVGVQINKLGNLELQGFFQHDWDNNNKFGTQLLWSK